MYIYTYIHIYIYTYIHIYIYTYIHIYIYTYIHIYIYTYIHIYIYTYIHIYIYYIHIHIYTYIHIYIYTYVHRYTYIHMYIYTYTHIYMYTYIHIYVYTYIHIYICTCMYTCMHAYIHTYIHTYIYTYIDMYVCMYEHLCIGKQGFPASSVTTVCGSCMKRKGTSPLSVRGANMGCSRQSHCSAAAWYALSHDWCSRILFMLGFSGHRTPPTNRAPATVLRAFLVRLVFPLPTIVLLPPSCACPGVPVVLPTHGVVPVLTFRGVGGSLGISKRFWNGSWVLGALSISFAVWGFWVNWAMGSWLGLQLTLKSIWPE